MNLGAMNHPFTSLKVLALLDHNPPRAATEIAAALGVSPKRVLHHTARLLKWDDIEVVEERPQRVRTGNVRKDGKAVITVIRTRVFRTTARGRARLDKKGGHKKLCPACDPKRRKTC